MYLFVYHIYVFILMFVHLFILMYICYLFTLNALIFVHFLFLLCIYPNHN